MLKSPSARGQRRVSLWAGLLAAAALACSNITVNIGSSATATPVPTQPPAAAVAPTVAPPEPTLTPPPPPATDTAPPPEEPTVPPTATPPFFGQLEISPSNSYVTSIGDFVVVGEIANVTEDWFDFIKVEVTYFDAGGNLLQTEDSYAIPLPLGPDEGGVFVVYSDIGGAPEAVSAYTVIVQDAQVTEETRYDGLEASVLDETTDVLVGKTWYGLKGEVSNNGSQDCTSASVTAGFYDAAGQLAVGVTASADPRPLPAGETGTFEINTGNLDEPYDHYRLWLECFEF